MPGVRSTSSSAPRARLNAIIWPLREKLSPPVFSQQHPSWTGGLAIPKLPVNKPWNVISSRDYQQDAPSPWLPSVVHELLPKPPTDFTISGITRDSAGAVLVSCVVNLFRTSDNVLMQSTTSDATTGAYTFTGTGQINQFLVSYKAGSPDVAGTSRNDLMGA